MALRVMGWEKETQYIRQLPHKYRGGEIGDWAKDMLPLHMKKVFLMMLI